MMPTTTTLIFFSFLLSHSPTHGAVLIPNHPLPLLTEQPDAANLNNNTTTSPPPSPNQLPTCVNTLAHPNWTGPIDPIGCNDAYELIHDRVRENLQTTYTFYSLQAFPQRAHRPPNGWPLPQGSRSGACAITVRMARDFAPASLPMSDGTDFPAAGAEPFQSDTWGAVLAGLDGLYTACVLGERVGWAVVGRGVVVAYWGRESVMDRDYGFRAGVGAVD